jgi:hypothetical protein
LETVAKYVLAAIGHQRNLVHSRRHQQVIAGPAKSQLRNQVASLVTVMVCNGWLMVVVCLMVSLWL